MFTFQVEFFHLVTIEDLLEMFCLVFDENFLLLFEIRKKSTEGLGQVMRLLFDKLVVHI